MRFIRLGLLLVLVSMAASAEGVWIPIAGQTGGLTGVFDEMVIWRGDTVLGGYLIWNGGTGWTQIPGAGAVEASAVYGDDLVVARHVFEGDNPEPIWRWDGTSWTSISGCPNAGQITSVTACGGMLYVGRRFQPSGGCILRWDGTTWTDMGVTGSVWRFASDGTRLYASGAFSATPTGAEIICWDGDSWSTLAGAPGNTVAFDPSAGRLWSAGSGLGWWDGSQWHTVSSPLNHPWSMAFKDGKVLVGGTNTGTIDTPTTNHLVAYDPVAATWTTLGTANFGISLVGVSGNDVLLSGSFTTVDGMATQHIARWDGAAWQRMTQTGTVGDVTCCAWRGEELFVGGSFTAIAGVPARNLARWDGTTWHAVDAEWEITAMSTDAGGRLWVAGNSLTEVAGVPACGVAWLDDEGWHAAGDGLYGELKGIYPDGDGVIVYGNTFKDPDAIEAALAARWDGESWTLIGPRCDYGGITAITRDAHGRLVAVGNFILASGEATISGCAVWKNEAWEQLGEGFTCETGDPTGVLCCPDGSLIVTGRFAVGTGPDVACAIWKQGAWHEGPDLEVRLLGLWRGRILALAGGPTVYQLGRHGWEVLATDTGSGIAGMDLRGDRLAVVGAIGSIDNRPCTGVALLDLAPPAAPGAVVTPGDDEGTFNVDMAMGEYEVRCVGGPWIHLGEASSCVLASGEAAARAVGRTSSPASGWELQRIDGAMAYSAKCRITSQGEVVADGGGGSSGGNASAGSSSGCGAGSAVGAGLGLALAFMQLRSRRRRAA